MCDFTPRSCRAALTSKEMIMNINIQDIPRKGCWKKANNFYKFYHRDLILGRWRRLPKNYWECMDKCHTVLVFYPPYKITPISQRKQPGFEIWIFALMSTPFLTYLFISGKDLVNYNQASYFISTRLDFYCWWELRFIAMIYTFLKNLTFWRKKIKSCYRTP